MSDTELADSVAAAGGRVMIGFKEPSARAGVDEWGNIQTSQSTTSAGKAYLEMLDVVIEDESKLAPMVVAVIDTSLIVQLRQNPLVDYVEPMLQGCTLDRMPHGTYGASVLPRPGHPAPEKARSF